jgi:hypothetical protein
MKSIEEQMKQVFAKSELPEEKLKVITRMLELLLIVPKGRFTKEYSELVDQNFEWIDKLDVDTLVKIREKFKQERGIK